MKFEKAMVTFISLEGADILTQSSGYVEPDLCTTGAFIAGDACGNQNQHDKFYKCTNNGHKNHGGQ